MQAVQKNCNPARKIVRFTILVPLGMLDNDQNRFLMGATGIAAKTPRSGGKSSFKRDSVHHSEIPGLRVGFATRFLENPKIT
jgi:hypothetical protein